MASVWSLLIVSACLVPALCYNVCYQPLGCFTDADPWGSTGRGHQPASPERQEIKVYLYDRQHKTSPELLDYKHVTSRIYDASRPTKAIVHGFQNSARQAWVVAMREAILNKEDVNLIVMDWEKGAAGLFNLLQAEANTRVVAAVLGHVTSSLPVDKPSMHCIGHSFGAQICGMAGHLAGGSWGRITGMDPARPGFENMALEVRLDASDAVYVDAIHTTGTEGGLLQGGFGVATRAGDYDIYVNGGGHQAGCGSTTADILSSCSHGRAHDLFIESITSSCPFTAFPCPGDWDQFKTGECLSCPASGCGRLGYDATVKATGEAYLVTEGKSPYCGYHYQVVLDLKDSTSHFVNRTVRASLVGNGQQSNFQVVSSYAARQSGSSRHEVVILSHTPLEPLTELVLRLETDHGAGTSVEVVNAAVVSGADNNQAQTAYLAFGGMGSVQSNTDKHLQLQASNSAIGK